MNRRINFSNVPSDPRVPRHGRTTIVRSKSMEDLSKTDNVVGYSTSKVAVLTPSPIRVSPHTHVSSSCGVYPDMVHHSAIYPQPSNLTGVLPYRNDNNSVNSNIERDMSGVSPIYSRDNNIMIHNHMRTLFPDSETVGLPIEQRDIRSVVRCQYMREHSIVSILNEMVEGLLTEKPDDPLTFLINFLEEIDNDVKATKHEIQRQRFAEIAKEKAHQIRSPDSLSITSEALGHETKPYSIVQREESHNVKEGQASVGIVTATSSHSVEHRDERNISPDPQNTDIGKDKDKELSVDRVNRKRVMFDNKIAQKEETIIVNREHLVPSKGDTEKEITQAHQQDQNQRGFVKETNVAQSRTAPGPVAKRPSIVRITQSGNDWYIPTIDSDDAGHDTSRESIHNDLIHYNGDFSLDGTGEENFPEEDISVVLQDMTPMKILMDALHRDRTPMLSICLDIARKRAHGGRFENNGHHSMLRETLGIRLLKRACCSKRCPMLYSLYQSRAIPSMSAITIPNVKKYHDRRRSTYAMSYWVDTVSNTANAPFADGGECNSSITSSVDFCDSDVSKPTIIVQNPNPIRYLLRAAYIQATPMLACLINHAITMAEDSARNKRMSESSRVSDSLMRDPLSSVGIPSDILGLIILQRSSMQGFKTLGILTNHWMVRQQIVLAVR